MAVVISSVKFYLHPFTGEFVGILSVKYI